MTVTNTNPTDHHKLNSAPKETGTEPLTSADEIFNEETLEALEEAELIAAHPENYKSYANFAEVLKDIFVPDYTLHKNPK